MTAPGISLTPGQAKFLAEQNKHVIVEETNLAPNVIAVRTPGGTDASGVQLVDRSGKAVRLSTSGIHSVEAAR